MHSKATAIPTATTSTTATTSLMASHSKNDSLSGSCLTVLLLLPVCTFPIYNDDDDDVGIGR